MCCRFIAASPPHNTNNTWRWGQALPLFVEEVIMKQVIQNFKTGELSVAEVPPPALARGFVLVRNHFSLISAGTERSTVSTARASLLGKARQRPDLVRQVLDSFRQDGFAETLKRVRTRLETLKELGYSSAGTVLVSLDTQGRFKPGDRVACGGGGYASHAGIVTVPQNLVVKVPATVGLDAAAFTTLGAIAMQGVRQADSRLGEFVCVIGLGLLGQITAQMLRANGCQVFGVDTAECMVALAEKASCHAARTRSDPGMESAFRTFTGGHGFDAVIVTAATQSTDPVELATAILRQKGVIVIVGAVPMNIPREPHFYKNELELKISCSYGPGRYDHNYEEEGQDYPYGYVRWTENRNMEAFVKLLENGSVDVQPLVTHIFEIEKAEKAYEIVTGKVSERHVGILLKYPEALETHSVEAVPQASTSSRATPGIGFIGAGSFAQKFLIPFAQRGGELISVVTSRGVTAKSVGEKFRFRSHATDAHDVLTDPAVNTVFIATRHDTHAMFAADALEAGKNVFVEKPLALGEDELSQVVEVASRHSGCRLLVGYNRRFSPLARQAREIFRHVSGPLLINYRVNAGYLPKDHWVQTEQGGGRILGEVCHFVDLMQFVTGSEPVNVYAVPMAADNAQMPDQDNVVISLRFRNGSVGQIAYVACGDKLLNKERLEIFGGGQSFVIDDFRHGEHYAGGSRRRFKLPGKGHEEEVEVFLRAIHDGGPSPIPLDSLALTTVVTFAILDSLHTGLPQAVSSRHLNRALKLAKNI
jgi:predicted dehydrogenase/threonine dehydrogenase-like Zn-dependent dehydrogenase